MPCKVDPQKPTYDALVAVFMGVPINTGKLSLLADIKAMKGKKGMDGLADGDGANKQAREILRRLVEWGDVVLCNQVRERGETCLRLPCTSSNPVVLYIHMFSSQLILSSILVIQKRRAVVTDYM